MVSLGRLPLTCGLFFSLGHSTIVIAVNIAIAISVDIYDKLGTVGSVGGIVGASVSSSFLFLVACINTYFLVQAVKDRRRAKARQAAGLPPEDGGCAKVHGGGCLVRIVAPILRAVDAPWKLYPVGILFGFGFDTASSIALLAISAIATRGPHGEEISHGKVVILPFLFTAGMSLVDSLDSVLMLYAYAQPELRTDGRWRLFTTRKVEVEVHPVVDEPGSSCQRFESSVSDQTSDEPEDSKPIANTKPGSDPELGLNSKGIEVDAEDEERRETAQRMIVAKTATMSSLSISLTLLSILVALAYVHPYHCLPFTHAQHLSHPDHGPHWRKLRQMYGRSGGSRRRRAGGQLVACVGESKSLHKC